MVWHVWTDGSCKWGRAEAPAGLPGCGGWCAIIEHGSEGEVVRGRVPNTTNVRMELLAATEGLRRTPAGADVVLHTDCTALLTVRDRLADGSLDRYDGRDRDYWLALAVELDARRVRLELLLRGRRDEIHRRAHVIAGAEARALLSDLPANVVPLEGDHAKIRRRQRRRVAALAPPSLDPAEVRRLAYRAQARRTWRQGLR